MFTDAFEWLQGLTGIYPIAGLAIIAGALFLLFAANGIGPLGQPRSHRPRLRAGVAASGATPKRPH